MPQILNVRDYGELPDNVVYIGRTIGRFQNLGFGNPFRLRGGITREELVRQYAAWLMTNAGLISKAQAELRGKDLACWCSPELCHGEVLMLAANASCVEDARSRLVKWLEQR